MLEVRRLSVRYGALTIVDDVSFALESGQWLMIAGPNGAGKSTLVSAITQGVPYSGQALLSGEDLSLMRPSRMARKVGVLTQNHHVGYAFTVEEVVSLGRYAYSGGFFAGRSDEDERSVEAALEQTGLLPMRRQSVLTLSGGELQRTFLAQLLAQDPQLLILDEPANHLDLAYQQQVFDLIAGWIASTGRSVVSVVHDLSLAKAYGTRAMLMNRGRCAAIGPAGEVLHREHLSHVYGMDVHAWMRRMLSQWE